MSLETTIRLSHLPTKRLFWWLLMLLVGMFGCTEKRAEDTLMQKNSPQSTSVWFENQLTMTAELNIIEYLYYYNGGGVAIGDINDDGLEDLFFTANQGVDSLYLNLGNFKFKNITKEAGLSMEPRWSNGVVMADVNGDGLLDIYVCRVGQYKGLEGHNLLYLNNGDETFSEASREAGLDFSGFSTQASFFDYDRDGDLDMYLLNHSVHTTRSYQRISARSEFDPLAGDRLFQNQLDKGQFTFKDVTREAGIISSALGYGLGLVTTDINQDGWIDIYVGNDFHEDDFLYINQKDGTFRQSSKSMIGHTSRFTMGVDVADVNGDNLFDIFSLDMLPEDNQILMKSGGEDNNKITEVKLDYGYGYQYAKNAFQLNVENEHFSEISLLTNTYASDWSWSVLLQDYDNDAKTDIFITNGIVKRPNDLDYINFRSNINLTNLTEASEDSLILELIKRMPTLKIPNFLYQNQGGLQFENVSEAWGLAEPGYSNGAAYTDLDNDGDLDLVINNINDPASIYENKTASKLRNHYIQFQLKGDNSNTRALGSKISIWTGGTKMTRELTSSRGFQSSPGSRIHFGLGEATIVDSVWIQWPEGDWQKLEDLAADSLYAIDKTATIRIDWVPEEEVENRYLEFSHHENDYRDYDMELLIPEKLSTEGPAVAVADFNGDGSMDLFIGASRGSINQLFLQLEGELVPVEVPAFAVQENMEAVDVAVFDLEGDGDQDLYVVHGGNDYPYDSPFFGDMVYVNDGRGQFTQADFNLPTINGGCVAAADYDLDGDMDLFVGDRAVPGGYGLSPFSFLVENRDGVLRAVKTWQIGMVSDADWVDYDGDGDPDLVLAGDWMPITIMRNDGNMNFSNQTEALGLGRSNGFWNTVKVADIDGDGTLDLVGGNLGLNSKLKATPDQPVELFLHDFDQNEQPDPVMFYYKNGESIPFHSRDELTGQIPYLKKAFLSYEEFARVRSIEQLTGVESDKIAEKKYLYDLSSGVFVFKQNAFVKQDFPQFAQLSPINDLLVTDVDQDGIEDVIYVGNFFGSVTAVGRYDASPGGVLKGLGDGSFRFLGFLPLDFDKEYRKILYLSNDTFVVVVNNGRPILLEKKQLIELFSL